MNRSQVKIAGVDVAFTLFPGCELKSLSASRLPSSQASSQTSPFSPAPSQMPALSPAPLPASVKSALPCELFKVNLYSGLSAGTENSETCCCCLPGFLLCTPEVHEKRRRGFRCRSKLHLPISLPSACCSGFKTLH